MNRDDGMCASRQPLTPEQEFLYADSVARLFHDLRHARLLSASAAVRVIAVGQRAEGATAIWQVHVDAGQVKAVGYQAYGCPHFLAACEWLARWLEGRQVTGLSSWQWREMEAALQVPAAKRGRLLLLDDVVRRLISN